MRAACTRCSAEAEVNSPDPRCISCFKSYLRKTFKTSLGRLGAGGRRPSLAIALSGGHSSCAVALLLQTYLKSLTPNPKVANTKLIAVHVSDGPIPAAVQEICERIDARLVTVPLEQIHVKDATDRRDIRCIMKMKLILRMARENGCDSVLLGTSLTRAAADVLQACIMARGTSVRNAAIGSIDVDDVRVVRPLKDVPVRQLARYAMLEMGHADFAYDRTDAGLYDIVQRFVEEAAEDNVASIHNVVKTAGKLLVRSGARCDVCSAIMVENEQSCGGCEGCDCEEKRVLCTGCSGCVQRGGIKVDTIFDEMRENERRRKGREAMFKEIEDFVL